MKKQIRCAIYTRKSTEEGLEQDFNSLDAQREACEAYIKSQQHEGWVLIEKQYNDGGFSGGSLERPAVQELFKDIEAGLVDIVVVYKVDRLTRSLMDFSKIVELFDKRNASFVSITQHFNTTTSMGRLTLNILLSFAQFEREVTGERIRDKLAASKKKGMWMGGKVPIGYQKYERTLVPDKETADTIKIIFSKYLELKTVSNLRDYLFQHNIKSNVGLHFSKGQLYYILANKVYNGKIIHKDKVYDGEHQALIDPDVFEQVQAQLLNNRIDKNCGTKSSSHSLLAGFLYDDKDNKMSPSHSNTRNKKYRYYVSQAIIQDKKQNIGSISKIPAPEIENLVKAEITHYLMSIKNIHKHIQDFDVHRQKVLLSSLEVPEKVVTRSFIRAILHKVIISKNKVEILLSEADLVKAIESITFNQALTFEKEKSPSKLIKIKKDIRISSTTRSGGIVIVGGNKIEKNYNQSLIKAIVRSHHYYKLLLEGKVKNAKDIQKLEGLKDHTYIKDILRLKFLPPEITAQILNGTQDKDLSVKELGALT